MTTEGVRRPTRKWLVWWTALNTLFLALPMSMSGLGQSPISFLGFMAGTVGSVVGAAVIGRRRGPWTRYVPVVLPSLLVGAWPLYRFLAYSDTRTGELFGVSEILFLGYLGLDSLNRWVRDRGWVVDSPWRRRTVVATTLAMAARIIFHLEHPVFRWGVIIAMFATMLWPSRRNAASS